MLLVRTLLRPSPIEGIGCFAVERIAAGTPIWRFMPCFDVMLPPSFCAEMCNAEFLDKYAQQCPSTGYYILCSDDARFMNHLDDPNVAVKAPLFDPQLTHDALRDIEAGEELTCDYRIGDIQPFYGFNTNALRIAA
jgi:hypothetical protein